MFEKVAIVGVGLLGGSLARELRHHKLSKRVVGVCRSKQTAKLALSNQVVDEILPLSRAVIEADLIVLATPMQSMMPILDELAPHLSKNAILTDVGSVKTDLYAELKRRKPELLPQFVLAHPIAGGEDSGVMASRLDLFKNKHVIITSTDEMSSTANQTITRMWQRCGARVVNMSLQTHDAIFAKTSHLSHVVAFSLVNYLSQQPDSEQLFNLAAAGFYDFTRIASSSAEMWRDICVTNKVEVLHALEGYRLQLDEIRELIEAEDQAGILEYFDAAREARNIGVMNKQKLNEKHKEE